MESMRTEAVELRKPPETNIIVGQSHFIKTVEDVYESLMNSVPGIRFGLAFCESSGDRLIRVDGNDEALKTAAVDNARRIAAGHTFVVVLANAYPVNVLRSIKDVPEVCGIFCATANDAEVLVAETDKGRGIIGVVDGQAPLGVETDEDAKKRRELLRRIGYKR
jgi:adenosine/AMP kinase